MKALTPVLLFVVASRSLPAMGAEKELIPTDLDSDATVPWTVPLDGTVKLKCNGATPQNSIPSHFDQKVCDSETRCPNDGATVAWSSVFPGQSSPVTGDCFSANGCVINIEEAHRKDTPKIVNLACGKDGTHYYVAKLTFEAKTTTAAPPSGGTTSSSTTAAPGGPGGSGTAPTTAAPGGSTTTTTSGSSFFSLGVASVTLAISTFLLL